MHATVAKPDLHVAEHPLEGSPEPAPARVEVDVRLLGPLEVEVAGEPLWFDGCKQRRLFALLALRAPDPVSADELAEALWGERIPAGVMQALQKHVSRLRGRLGGRGLSVCHQAAGYSLEIDPQAIDCRRFEELLASARIAMGRDDPHRATADLQAALGLWRGEALADYRFDEFAQREIARLEELRMEAIEEWLAARLASGGGEDLVGELRALVTEHPLRERLRGQLMVALYRAGRQAEALEAMRVGRRLLVEELGIEPGPELRELERMILAHDSALAAERPRSGLAGRLPVPANETIGRGRELSEIEELLVGRGVRLVTLVGPGGVGKTRLALEAARSVAARFPAGAVFIDLDGVEDAGVLVAGVASALGVVAATVAELGERLSHATRGAPALLVLDGFDPSAADARQVGELLSSVANLTVLVTGRAPLRLCAEHVYRVQPLAATSAAALFTARVRAVLADRAIDEDRSVIDAICARLDGLPLAIELAADRARLLPLPALLERLEQRLELLTGGPCDLPERQRSLRVMLELSWEALPEPERELLSRLTVFEGGASLEAAQATCGVALGGRLESLFCSLLDNSSLLRLDSGTEAHVRVGMLDTVREFVAEHASAREDLTALERRHASYFLSYCEHAAEHAARTDQRHWLDLLARERANVRLAFDRLLRAGATDDALRVAIGFAQALPWDAHAHEVRGWLAHALTSSPPPTPTRRASGLYWDGALALAMGLFGNAAEQLTAALTAAREAEDHAIEAAALTRLGRRAILTSAADAAALCESALGVARRVGDPMLIADALLTSAGACERSKAWRRAGTLAGQALELYRAVGDPYGAAWALAELGWYDMIHGRLDESDEHLAEALELRRRHGDDRRLVEPLIDHAWLMLARGRDEEAAHGFLDCLALARHVGDQFIVGEALAGLSTQAGRERRWADAALLAGASATVHQRIGASPWESVTDTHERALADARDALGAPLYASRFAEGMRSAPEEAAARTQSRMPEQIRENPELNRSKVRHLTLSSLDDLPQIKPLCGVGV